MTVDIYKDTPVRLFGFTNEIGAAVAPIIGPVGELASYIPSATYIALDTRDKFKRGDDDTYTTPSKKRALEELIFQLSASVYIPTAIVKAAQGIADKVVSHKMFDKFRSSTTEFVSKNDGLSKIVNRFADKTDHHATSALAKFAHGFENTLNKILLTPSMFPKSANKSGLRNIGLAAVGLTTLGLVIKPVDHFVEHVMIEKLVKPLLHGNEHKSNHSGEDTGEVPAFGDSGILETYHALLQNKSN